MIVFFRHSREPQRPASRDVLWLLPFGLLLAGAIYALKWSTVDVTTFRFAWEDLKESENLAVIGVEGTLVVAALLFRKRVLRFGLAFTMLLLTYAVILPRQFEGATRVYVARDFFGVKKVLFDLDTNMKKLVHGDTMHGLESLDIHLAGEPLSYYHRTGPVGDVMEMLGTRPQQRIGVVGLGTGTLAAYGTPDRRITFFDVDPQVVHIASGFFTFVRRCGSNCNVEVGDGRLSIQARADAEFDSLILDAFNSDSIPGHLVSREAVRMYMQKLKPNGILLFHVSNRYLDVEKLAAAAAWEEGLLPFARHDDDEEARGKASSDWVAVVRDVNDLKTIPNGDAWQRVERPTDVVAWTDDYSNMMSIIRPW
jgi:SAM-dependent methyltransferase